MELLLKFMENNPVLTVVIVLGVIGGIEMIIHTCQKK